MSVTSLPMHDEAHVYTSVPADRLKWTLLHVADGRDSWRVRTQFLNGDRYLMIHSAGSDACAAIIHQTEIQLGVRHTVRTRSWAARSLGRGSRC